MVFALDPDTGQPILRDGDLVRLTDPLEILAQAIRVRLRTVAGEIMTRVDIGLDLEELLELGATTGEIGGMIRREVRAVAGVRSIDALTVAPSPDEAGKLVVTFTVRPLVGSAVTGQVTL